MLRAIQYPNLCRKWRTERKWVVHFRNIDNSKEKSSWLAVFITFLIYLKEEYFTEKKLKTSNPWQRNWFYIKMKWRCTKNPPSYKLLFNITLFNLFVCLGFIVLLEIFHSYVDVNITSEGLQILTFARHSWPLSSEGSLACNTYFDTEHPFIMVISEDPWHSNLLPSV